MGRLIQQGDNLAIRTELVNVADGTELWGEQYNRKLADVFAVQEEIAKEISEKLRLKLSGAERQQLAKRPTENLKAFQYYMQGRSYQPTSHPGGSARRPFAITRGQLKKIAIMRSPTRA